MNLETLPHDVFLSHSAKDKALVRASTLSVSTGERAGARCRSLHWTKRLRQDGLNPKAEGGKQKAEILHPSPCAFGSDWTQLEADTLGSDFGPRTSDFGLTPPLRLDDAPIKGSLAQFLYINWRPADREQKGLKSRKTIAQASTGSAAVEWLQEYTALITAADNGRIDDRRNPDTITS